MLYCTVNIMMGSLNVFDGSLFCVINEELLEVFNIVVRFGHRLVRWNESVDDSNDFLGSEYTVL